jgi:IclR family pca regulon transcriptional regulator
MLGVHFWELGNGIIELKRLSKFDDAPALQFGRFGARQMEREESPHGLRTGARLMSPSGQPDASWQESLLSYKNGEMSQSLERGLAILGAYSSERPLLGIAEIADALDMSRPTVHRYASTLTQLGFLEQGARRKYRLAPRAADAGAAVLRATGLPDCARPYVAGLRERIGYTVSLAVLDGAEIVYAVRAYSHSAGQFEADAGRRFGSRVPASCTALGKALVAGLPMQDGLAWTKVTTLTPAGPNAIVTKSAFRAELDRIREQGFAVNDRELVARMVAVAVPIRRGDIVRAAIAVAANANVITASKLADTCREALLATATDMSEHIQYDPRRRRRAS